MDSKYQAAIAYDTAFESRRWATEIPALKFPTDWEIRIVPPFGGALARFRVNDKVSVYLDGYDQLGLFGEPYWEIYPIEDDVFRCRMADTESLLNAIQEALDETNHTEE